MNTQTAQDDFAIIVEIHYDELPDTELDQVCGGAARRVTGPGTQTEDDVYVG